MAKQEKSAAELYREERKARIAKSAKKNAKKSISADSSAKAAKVIAVVLVLALVGGICGMIVNLTGVVDRSRTAFYVGDVIVSQPEYSYYYSSIYQMYAQYAAYGYIDLDTSTTPDKQEYSGSLGEIEGFPEDQTPMWTDFFEYNAKQRIQYTKACVKEAEKLGLKLSDEQLASIDSNISEMEESAKANNYSLSSYLRASIGKGMTVGIYRKILEEQQICELVQDNKSDELAAGYTDKQVAKEYKKNTVNYATVYFRSYVIKAETVKDEEADTEKATDETMAAAKKVADKLAADAKDEASFKDSVALIESANDNKDYKEFLTDDSLTLQSDVNYETVSGSVSDEDFLDWLFSEKTETYVLENADTGYTVYLMVAPSHKAPDSDIYDVRHILVKFPEEEETADTADEAEEAAEEETTAADGETTEAETTEAETTKEETTAAPEVKVETLDTSKYSDVTIDLAVNADTAKDKATYKKAQDILKEYLDGDKTASSFAKLAQEYTEDSNGADGGLYSDVPRGQMVSEFEDWCLKDGRKEGDVGIVETTYGYHIMYFVKRDVKTWDDDVREALASADLDTYIDELVKADDVKVDQVNDKAIASTEDFLVKLVKNQIKNSAQSLSH